MKPKIDIAKKNNWILNIISKNGSFSMNSNNLLPKYKIFYKEYLKFWISFFFMRTNWLHLQLFATKRNNSDLFANIYILTVSEFVLIFNFFQNKNIIKKLTMKMYDNILIVDLFIIGMLLLF